VVDGIRQIARGCGYAIGEHGTRIRDLDLIAVPWVDWAIPAELLVRAIAGGLQLHVVGTPEGRIEHGLEEKPHGRRAWSLLCFTEACWASGTAWRPPRAIDLSVMPCA
jgi:hypothetical protein